MIKNPDWNVVSRGSTRTRYWFRHLASVSSLVTMKNDNSTLLGGDITPLACHDPGMAGSNSWTSAFPVYQD
jgi:hypothetical protein